MEKTKRVILVQGEGVWYEQAIFIVKNGMDARNVPKDFVLEAERIIENYLNPNAKTQRPLVFSEGKVNDTLKLPLSKPEKKTKRTDWFLNISMIVCVLVLSFLISRLISG